MNPHGTCGKDGTCHGGSREQVKTCGGKKKYGEKDSWGSWGSEVCRFLWKRRKQSKKKKIGFWKGFINEKKTGEVAASWKRGEG